MATEELCRSLMEVLKRTHKIVVEVMAAPLAPVVNILNMGDNLANGKAIRKCDAEGGLSLVGHCREGSCC